MSYLILLSTVIVSGLTNVFGKCYNQKNKRIRNTTEFYNLILVGTVCACWAILFFGNMKFDFSVLPYSFGFAFFYVMFMICNINALKIGSVAITTLISNFASMLVTVWGFIFWEDTLTLTVGIGLVLAVAALVLCLSKDKNDKKPFSFRWLTYTILVFIGNAGCSIVQKTQQMSFDGEYGDCLMFFAAVTAFTTCLIVFFVSDKTQIKEISKHSKIFPVLAGVSNVAFNIFVIKLAVSELTPSLIDPVIGVGTLIIVALSSMFLFKEKLTAKQWLGILLGSMATVLLSI